MAAATKKTETKKAPAKKAAAEKLPEPTLRFETPKAWHTWLSKNHDSHSGVLMEIAKANTGVASITHPQALDVALCWGWIDAVRRAKDGTYFVQRFTPRRKQSIWSKINCDKVMALVASGAMQPPGLAEIERAKADGRWERAYDGSRTATVPDDLAAALAKSKKASAAFATLDSRNRYAILHRLMTAKKEETRVTRIAKFVGMLERGEKFY